MMTLLRTRLLKRLGPRAASLAARWRASGRAGSALLEFALVAPIFFLLVMGIIETGVLFLAQSALDTAVDDAARLVRTGQAQAASMTAAQFRTTICNEINTFLPCTGSSASNLQIDLRSYSSFSGMTYPAPLNADGTLNSAVDLYAPGTDCNVVLVRGFYVWTFVTPWISFFMTNMQANSGQRLLVSGQAFRNEPYDTSVAGC